MLIIKILILIYYKWLCRAYIKIFTFSFESFYKGTFQKEVTYIADWFIFDIFTELIYFV